MFRAGEMTMLVLLIGSLIVGQFQPGSPAPGFELERADGTGQVRLDQMRGRYVVVYFWLPSTENDAVDARELDAIRQGPGCDGVTVLTVLYPPDETASAMALLRKEDVGFDVLVGTDEVAEKYGADQTRALVVIDPGGVIDTISHRGMPAELYSYLERRTDEAARRWLDSLSVPEAEIDSARCRRVLASLDSFLRVFTSNKWPGLP
ncbi:MAG: redoxin domain-containing protein [candidate division WOR-3 bacterium]|nr:redoxin domain-containing protein [candidate division WOR-3 bacterium]